MSILAILASLALIVILCAILLVIGIGLAGMEHEQS